MALLVVSIVPMSAKVKERNLCQDMLYFEGEVVKNKETKLKEPTGEGKLFLPRNWKNKEYDIYIQGEFNGNKVNNGSFCISDYSFQGQKAVYTTIFQGNIAYAYSYDKAAKTLTLTIELLEGMLFADGEGRIPVSQNSSIIYAMKFKKGDWIPYKSEFQIYPQSISFKSQNPPKEPLMGTLMESYEWVANMSTPRGEWDLKCKGGVLKNGMKCTFTRNYPYFSLSGKNDSYMQYNGGGYHLRLPLIDGGFFEWDKKQRSARLYFSNGDMFEGTFKKVPFKNGTFDYSYDAPNVLDLVSSILRASSSDFTMENGTYTYSSGKTEKVMDGNILNSANLSKYYSIISKATELSNKDKFIALCKKDFWAFIGRPDISELDKEVYKKSAEYPTAYKNYQSSLDSLYYEIIDYGDATFSASKAVFNIEPSFSFSTRNVGSFGYQGASSLPLIPCNAGSFAVNPTLIKLLKFNGNYKEDVIQLAVPSSDLNYLQALQSAHRNNELGFLLLMKPGAFYYDYYFPTPIGIYLINKDSKTILADLSHCVDKAAPANYKSKVAKQKAYEDAEWNQEPTYHKQAKRITCTRCSGKGYWLDDYYNSNGYWTKVKRACSDCHGTGYIVTHNY